MVASMQKHATEHDAMSIRELMAHPEAQKIIDDPREYQVELYERAKKENIVAVLDTGKL